MELSPLLLDFFQRIAIGAATVFALLVVVSLGMPRRAVIPISRRTIR